MRNRNSANALKYAGLMTKYRLYIKEDVVYKGNMAKFTQNEDLRRALLETGDATLAEASPYDAIWGIGRKASERLAQVPEKWKGTNLLGKVLMRVRAELSK